MSDSTLAPLLFESVEAVQITRYCQLAAGSLVIFDNLITLDEEVNFIWQRRWSFGKCLFLTNRYFSLAVFVFNIYSAFFTPKLSDSITNSDTVTLNVESSQYVTLWILITRLLLSAGQVLVYPGGNSCVPTNIAPHFYAFWIPVLLFESVLCTLAIASSFQSLKRIPSGLRRGTRGLVYILIRDSIAYFFIIGSAYLTCLLMWILAPTRFVDTPVSLVVGMTCVLGNRVFMNVRRAAHNPSSLMRMPWMEDENQR
ncbi:hypothetical protein GALMADRAFT_134772 [Galerina marginata CBS 339.88]|uniref:DUF6533 domain-containing protein n=1 Tax=Galerina marginata (strain CBS 339.88) TaxID=685588 RepID=A0A067TWA1_GALM3|nr:hypothetical protein GALMADRAFT_134772 [Galerina marginata CBS 339.88]